MQAIILLGGKGTRLQGLFPNQPKALVPIAGRPFLEWQLAWLFRQGVSSVHLAAGYLGQAIRDWIAATPPPSPVSIGVEPVPLGTAGGLKYAEPFIRSDPFLVLNGDSLLPNLDFQDLRKTAKIAGTIATLAVVSASRRILPGGKIESADRYGTVEFNEQKRITAFREKAAQDSVWINGGVYLAQWTLLSLIKPDKMLSLETDLFPTLCAEGRLSVCCSKPPLLDMGTPEGIQAMERYLG